MEGYNNIEPWGYSLPDFKTAPQALSSATLYLDSSYVRI